MKTTKQDKAASKARIEAQQVETRAVVEKGVCPTCGAGIKHNLSLTGWVQCNQYGSVGFRKDSSKPACSWQGFTQ